MVVRNHFKLTEPKPFKSWHCQDWFDPSRPPIGKFNDKSLKLVSVLHQGLPLLVIRIADGVSLFTNSIRRLQRSIYQCNYSDSGARPRLPDSPLSGETALHFSTFGRSKYLAACVLSCEATHLIVLINSSAPPTAVDTCCVLLIYGSTVYTIYRSGLYCKILNRGYFLLAEK